MSKEAEEFELLRDAADAYLVRNSDLSRRLARAEKIIAEKDRALRPLAGIADLVTFPSPASEVGLWVRQTNFKENYVLSLQHAIDARAALSLTLDEEQKP